MEELRKIPDKNMLLQDYLSPYYVSDFKISDNHLILIIKNDYNKSCSICSLARQLLSLENIKDVYVSYSNDCYNVDNLTVIRDSGKRKGKAVIWECQCQCGQITYADGWSLRSGCRVSCGCLKSSGEKKIKSLLTENNILFKNI